MASDPGPWHVPPSRSPPPPPARRRGGLILWLGLLGAAALAFLLLSRLYPGQLASAADRQSAWYDFGLLAVVTSGLVFGRRLPMRHALRNVGIWIAIGAGIILAYSLRGEVAGLGGRLRAELLPGEPRVVDSHTLALGQSEDGSFYGQGEVNGAPTRFLLDTGATDIVLSPDDARRARIDLNSLSFSHPAETANGVGRGAWVTVDELALGQIRLRNVPVTVNAEPMAASLLGMSFFHRLEGFQVRGGRLYLTWRADQG